MPDERLRAVEFAKELTDTMYLPDSDEHNREKQVDNIVSHDKEIYDSAMREAAGLVCGCCKNTGNWNPAVSVEGAQNIWQHTLKTSPYSVWGCDAGPIWEHMNGK